MYDSRVCEVMVLNVSPGHTRECVKQTDYDCRHKSDCKRGPYPVPPPMAESAPDHVCGQRRNNEEVAPHSKMPDERETLIDASLPHLRDGQKVISVRKECLKCDKEF